MNSEKYLTDFYRELGNQKYDFRNYNLNKLISSKIKGKSVLDVGCGNCFLLGILKSQGKEVYGIETILKI